MGKEEETTQVNTRISAFRKPTRSPAAIPLPSKFYELGRGLGKMRSVPAPCHHHPPLSPIWPGLLTHAWVRPSPTTIQRRLLGLDSIADRPPPAAERPCGGRREAGRGPGTPHPFLRWGREERCRRLHRAPRFLEFWSPRRYLRFKWGGERGPLPTHLNPVLRAFPRQGSGVVTHTRQTLTIPDEPRGCPFNGQGGTLP